MVLNRERNYSVIMITTLFVNTHGGGHAVSPGLVLLRPFPDEEMEAQRGSDSLKVMVQINDGTRI